jgi:ribosomal protein S18 acetylase RimI-like enzyme
MLTDKRRFFSQARMMQIRPFQPGDEPGVVDLWRRCDLVRPQNDPHRDIARKMEVGAEMFLVAVTESVVVGTVMAGYEGHRGWINYLAVDPGQRRRGIGRKLMLEAERLLRESGCPKINLQVRSSNRAVIAFYEAIGFTVDDVVSMGRRLEKD